MPSPESLAAQLEEARHRAREAGKEEKAARARREQWETLAAFLEGQLGALTDPSESATVNAMNAIEKTADALRSHSRSAYKENAFVKARGEKGETIGDVKKLLEERFPGRRFHQNVIQTWYVPVGKDSHRDCPIEVREFLRDHYGKFTTGPHKGAWRVALDSWPLERGR